jgi:hypothetical protein
VKVVQRAEQGQRRITLGEAAAIAWSLGRSIDELVKFAETATFEPPKRGRNRFLIDPEPMLPTYGYRILCHNATLIDLEAEGMWPIGTQLQLLSGTARRPSWPFTWAVCGSTRSPPAGSSALPGRPPLY